MFKKGINDRGVGRKETMMVMLMILIFIGIILYFVVNNRSITEYRNFRRLASNFVSYVSNMRAENAIFENGAYLYDVIDEGYSEKFISPFNSDEECNVYESRVKVQNDIVYVTLRCSDYMIYNQISTDKHYKIYKISDWTTDKLTGNNVQMVNFYNYSLNGVEQLPRYFCRKEFMVNYYNNTGKKIYNEVAISSDYELLEKPYYRKMDEVN